MCKNIITSKNNNLIKEVKFIRDDKKYREEKSLCFIEGERLVNDTPINLIDKILLSNDYVYDTNDKHNILNKINKDKIFYIDHNIFDNIKDTKNSQGIIGIVKTNYTDFCNINGNKIVVFDDIMDPGNLGTMFRISEAMGFNNIILSDNTCDPYNTKTLRASMSSIFRLNIYRSENLYNDLESLKKHNYSIYGTILNESSDYLNFDYNNKIVLIMGNEANGINKKYYNLIDYKIRINMLGEIESLNVAVAYAIITSEIRRQEENEKN